MENEQAASAAPAGNAGPAGVEVTLLTPAIAAGAPAGGEAANAAAKTPEQIAQAASDQAAADLAAKGGKSDGEKTDEEKAADKAKEDAKPKAPEKYEFKLPEGASLNPDVQAQFEAIARELDMPQEAAQKLVETMGPKIAAAQADAVAKVQAEWMATSRADKEFGGDKLDANLAVAKKAMDTFGSPALTAMFNETGLGNHPEMIRMMFKAGQAISTDKFVAATQGSAPGAKDKAKTLYPNQN